MFNAQDAADAAAPHCYVCGAPSSSGKDLVEITRLLSAHRSCFVGHQAYSVLNTGREEESPAANGMWRYDWHADLPKYVKPEYAAAVSVMLAKTKDNAKEAPQMSDVMLKQIRSAAQEGFWAFCQVATIG